MKEALRIVAVFSFYLAGLLGLSMCNGGCTALKPYQPALVHLGECVAACAGGIVLEVAKIGADQKKKPAPIDPAPTASTPGDAK